ncbi:anti-sigma regulatory factor [Streptomyces sp. NPDC015131]|uniref:anti-sigma regulatory factor n=1 Tax=Streptomyces sp. NPDC015131 TaxID=3364941 RepID=UPI0036F7EB76
MSPHRDLEDVRTAAEDTGAPSGTPGSEDAVPGSGAVVDGAGAVVDGAGAGEGVGGVRDGDEDGDGATHPLRSEEDLLAVRHAVRAATLRLGFSLVDQTRIVTAASELARNAYIHGHGGTCEIRTVRRDGRTGLQLSVRDQGPGIPDVEEAFTDGYTTGAGLGHGLGGARRLMDEFDVRTAPGRGTTVVAIRWARPL